MEDAGPSLDAGGSSVDSSVLGSLVLAAEARGEHETSHYGEDQEGEEEEEESVAETNGEDEVGENSEHEIDENGEENETVEIEQGEEQESVAESIDGEHEIGENGEEEEEERSRQNEASNSLRNIAVSTSQSQLDLPIQIRSPPTLGHLSFYAAQRAITVMNVQQDSRYVGAASSPSSNTETHPSQQTQQQDSSNPQQRSEPQQQNPPQQPNQQRQLSIRHHDNQPSTSSSPDTPETRRWHPRPGFETRQAKSPTPSVSASTQTAITNPPNAFSRGQWVRVNGQRVPLRQYTLETRPNPPLAQIIRNPMFPAELLNQIRAAARDAAPARDATSAGRPLDVGRQQQRTQTMEAGQSRDVDTGEEHTDRQRRALATDVDRGEEEVVPDDPPSSLASPQVHDVDLGEAQDEEEALMADLRRQQQLVERSHDIEEQDDPAPMRVSTDVDDGNSHEEQQNRNNHERRRPEQTTQTPFTHGSVFDPPVLHLYPLQAIDLDLQPAFQYFPFPLPPARLVPPYNQFPPLQDQPQRNNHTLFLPFPFLQVFQSYGVRGSPSWPQERERRNHRRHSANSNLESEL